jgi:molybdenum cofactor sulfurtransferase
LVERFSADLITHLYGNPHSESPSSKLSTLRVDNTRLRVLQFFRADPEHFDVIFVANASAAIKLVGDCLRDCGAETGGFQYVYHKDAHSSLVGLRELASAGARCLESDQAVERWLTEDDESDKGIRLFAYPAQSNMNGHRPPLSWCGRVRRSLHKNTYSLLDAAAFCTTAQLDLGNVNNAPSFTALSFYKIFGFPDMGALIVRKADGHVLKRRRYFGGGTVEMVVNIGEQWHAKKDQTLHDRLEDGTLPFHNIVALDHALAVHEKLYGTFPMTRISKHTCYLAKVLYDGMSALYHFNGEKLCEIYQGPGSAYGNSQTQGPTIAFNLRNSEGGWISNANVDRLAIIRGCHIRTGGVCNPGGIATSLGLESWEMRRNFAEGTRCGNDLDIIEGSPTGICRVGLGAMSSLGDVETFLQFLRDIFVERAPVVPKMVLPPQGFVAHLEISVQNKQSFQARQKSFVYGLQISPIQGCPSWKVPLTAGWVVKETGLAWDHEWCLVQKDTRLVLDPRHFPKMALIKSRISLEEGLLVVKAENGPKKSR